MSYGPQDSRIKLTAAEEAHVATLQPEGIKEFMREVALRQNLVSKDLDPNILIENENPPEQPTQFTKRMLVNGKTLEFSGASELEVERAIGEYFRGEQASREESVSTTQRTVAAGETPAEVQARVELELKFKRGEISASQYIEQSGAVKNYLAEQGVDLEDLKVAVQHAGSERFTQSWADATDEFMQTLEGQTWEGGEENKNIIGQIIADAELVDEPSADTLVRAVRFARENHMLVPNPELERNRKIAEATSPEQIREALGRADASTIFGR
jgi:hypothetical protein